MTASDLVTGTSVEKPDEWPMRTAASFNPFITSGSRGWAKYYADHGDLFMRITNLKRHRIKPDLSDRQHVALPASEKEGLRTGLRNGDILISITADIGIIGYVDENIPTPAYINQHVACLRLPADQVSPKFVAYYLASSEPQRRFIEMTDVGAKTGINLTTVGKLTFPCPPLAEQEAIAEALSDADALIEGLERLIAKKRLIKQGAMQDLLTAKRRLPGFSGEWKVRRLGDIFEIGSSKRVFQRDWRNFGIPFYRAREIVLFAENLEVEKGLHISPDLYESLKKVSGVPEKGDLLVTGVGTLGRVYLVESEDPFYFKDGNIIWFKIRGSMSSEFLRQVFRTDEMMQQIYYSAGGSTVGTYTISNAKKTRINFPPVDEQAAIARVLDDMDSEIQALETRLEKARQVKEGMMQNLLTGRVRLV
ncbi:restriction endonuclease subunit S [Phaeobacter italicus]|uniref:restriction endonuclease subunit S n=1 Tax=Phaeobacter italicus TaxID=481446 RepID=UPI001ADB0142|nr:restriction endonuclease subunit S [Phaeobacter italicus]MBO9444161.1 restriction endonuclease subunit S [Phaeobacter italicus]